MANVLYQNYCIIYKNKNTRIIWKVLSLNMKMALFGKIILVLQLYMFCKILVKIIAILDAQLLFESFVSVDVSVSVKMEKIE